MITIAAVYDGSIRIDTRVNSQGFNVGRRQIERGLGGLTKSVGKFGTALGLAFGITALIRFGAECIEIASNAAEVQNVVDVAFGSMSYKCEEFAKTSIKQFGMSSLVAKKIASNYMAMGKSMGLSVDTASDMAVNVAKLTGDVASFYNISQEMAHIRLRGIWTGETEALKELGIVMTEINLKEYALAQGMTKSYDAMTQAERVSLRYAYVMNSLKDAQGDFIRTQDSWANQTRILSEQFKELMGILGTGFIAALTPAVQFLNEVLSRLIAFAQTAAAVITSLYGKSGKNQDEANGSFEEGAGALGDAAGGAEDLGEQTEQAAKEAKKLLTNFDELNQIGSDSDTNSNVPGVPALNLPPVDTLPLDEAETKLDELGEKMAKFLQEWAQMTQPTVDAMGALWEALEPLKTFVAQGLVDFYEYCLKPIGAWWLGEGLPRFILALKNGLERVDFERINASLRRLFDALSVYHVKVGEGLLWFWENVLVPLGTWVMNEVVPRFLDLLAAALTALCTVIEILAPHVAWLFETFLLPIAQWTGGVIISVLEGFTDALYRFSDWARENPEAIQAIFDVIMALLAGIVFYCATKKVIDLIYKLNTAFSAFGMVLNAPLGQAAILAVGLFTLIQMLMRLKEAWGHMTGAEKLQAALGGIIAVAFAAAMAVGAFQSALSMGLAAVAIVAGIAALMVVMKAAENRAKEATQQRGPGFNSIGRGSGFAPSGRSMPFGLDVTSIPKLATGAVIPPNNEFLAVLGDQKRGYNYEVPDEKLRQLIREETGGGGSTPIELVVRYDRQFIRGLHLELSEESRRKGVKLSQK